MKRLLAFAIAVMMVFAMVPVSVSAAVTEVDALSDFGTIESVGENGDKNGLHYGNVCRLSSAGEYKLTADINTLDDSDNTFIQIYDVNGVVIDLNGHTLALDPNYNAIQIFKSNVTIKNGTVRVVENSMPTPYNSTVIFADSSYGQVSLTLENVTLVSDNRDCNNVQLNGNTILTATDCEFIAKASSSNLIITREGANVNIVSSTLTSDSTAIALGGTENGSQIPATNVTISVSGTDVNATKAINVNGSSSATVDVNGGEWDGEFDTTANATIRLNSGEFKSESAQALIDATEGSRAKIVDEFTSEKSVTPNFFMFMFMKRLLTEYAVELVYDDTMGIVEIDDADGYVRFSKDVVVTVAALEGYEVETVLVNGKEVELDEDGTCTIERIKKDAKVEVTFAEVVEEEIEDEE